MAEEIPAGLELIVLDDKMQPCANPATRAIPVFREIFARIRRGRTVGKGKADKIALQEFMYIYYMVDIRSFAVQKYPGSQNDQQRHDTVVETLELPEEWMPDKGILDAAEWYHEYKFDNSPLMRMLRAGYRAISRTIDYFENLDYDKKDSKGKPVYDPKEVLKELASFQDQKENILKLQRQVVGEINRGGSIKGGGQLNPFEDAPDNSVVDDYKRMPDLQDLS